MWGEDFVINTTGTQWLGIFAVWWLCVSMLYLTCRRKEKR